MAILNREDFFNRLEAQIHSDTSDESISFLEDMQDTYNDLERKANGDGEDWKAKYEQLDASWRARYRHRFFNGGGGDYSPRFEGKKEDEDSYDPESVTLEDLFKESEGK